MQLKNRLDLITLPLRATVLLFLLWGAFYFGYGTPQLEWRQTSPETGVVAKYSRDGRPWRTFYDRNQDKEWDMWIDERAGAPRIVSIDDNGDGQPDRDQDEFGNPLPAWRSTQFRAQKTLDEFVHNPRQVFYIGLALMLYVLLEFLIRSVTARR